MMLVVLGLFYTAGTGISSGTTGLIFDIYSKEKSMVLMNYVLVILLEVVVFFGVMGETIKKEPYYYIVMIELILFPLYRFSHYNFLIRGTIPALFILMIYCMSFLLQQEKEMKATKRRKAILIMVLSIGAVTPMLEMRRSMKITGENENTVNESVYSFGNMRTEDEGLMRSIADLFLVYDYKNSAYYKYLGKK